MKRDMVVFNFYNTFYKNGTFTLEEMEENTKWGCITTEDFKDITGKTYTGEVMEEI